VKISRQYGGKYCPVYLGKQNRDEKPDKESRNIPGSQKNKAEKSMAFKRQRSAKEGIEVITIKYDNSQDSQRDPGGIPDKARDFDLPRNIFYMAVHVYLTSPELWVAGSS
jgi:hypothetical protein